MTTQTIPASEIVAVNPGVIGTGGNPLVLNGVILSPNTLIPADTVQPFDGNQAVEDFFGPDSAEAAISPTYFSGFDTSTLKPGVLFFAPFNVAARAAWNQSGSFLGVPLATLQAFNGTLDITVDGYARAASSLNFSADNSFSAIAAAIATGLNASPSTEATSSAASISGTTLTVGGTITGFFASGQTVLGSGVTAASIITAQLTGTAGGAGTYSLSQSSTVSSEAITTEPTPLTVAWNAVNATFTIQSGITGLVSTIGDATGTIAAGLQFTSATGAILSQGAPADTPTSAAANIAANTQNWAAFTTLVEPSLAHKLEYAVWSNQQNNRYLYVGWDTDAQAIVANATEPFGVVVDELEYNGVMALYNTLETAVFVLGSIASINFNAKNGRITLMGKTQSGFTPTVTNAQIANNLLANGYSFYGAYATANQQFNFFNNGQMAGEWKWVDPFVNQIYLNSQFQLALLTLLTTVNSIPYTPSGYALIRAAMLGPIQQALNFGSIRAGVTLSPQQIAEVNEEAGVDISQPLQNSGWYLQVLDPGAQVRGQRGTPVINFWYTDGGAVQRITLSSIDIE